MDDILAKFPFRESETAALWNLVCDFSCPLPIFVFGHNSCGKTTIVKSVLKSLEIDHTYVNCSNCCGSQQLLFADILDQVVSAFGDCKPAETGTVCSTTNQFILRLKQLLESPAGKGYRNFGIVFDSAERLRDLPVSTVAALLRLKQLVGNQIVVLLLSCLPWSKFHCCSTGVSPVPVYFRNYSRDQLLHILCLDAEDQHKAAYEQFVRQVLSVFYSSCCDLRELRYIVKQNWAQYAEPLLNVETSLGQTPGRQWQNIKPHLTESLQKLYLRENKVSAVTSVDVTDNSFVAPPKTPGGFEVTEPVHTVSKLGREVVELPFYTKYLLLSSYLASFCEISFDRRLFQKHHGKTKVSRRRPTKSAVLTQAHGPKAFSLNRLLTIFYAVFSDELQPHSLDYYVQISSLVTLGLLSRLGKADNLGAPKYKCCASFDFVKNIALNLGLNLEQYLLEGNKK